MDSTGFAPIGIVTLNRYDHFKQCIESLEKCIGANKTDVFIALDYPPSDNYKEGWQKIDYYLKEKQQKNKFKKLVVFRREHNHGIKGYNSNCLVLSNFLSSNYACYIESEDDNVFSPNFLLYMNQCLEKYKDDPDVMAVTGYSFPVDWKTSQGATIQKQTYNCSAWGWGWWTEKRKIVSENIRSGEMYDRAPGVLKNGSFRNKSLFVTFYEYVCAAIIPIKIFKIRQSGRLNVTDYCTRQYLAVYNKYVISPLVSKVRNIGVDGSGIYCQNNNLSDSSGTTSWNTDFTNQKIDESSTFEIVENDVSLLDENRKILDTYEWRPMQQHIIANCIAFCIRIFGLNFMRHIAKFVLKIWHRRIN